MVSHSAAMVAIADYAIARGWNPIGHRSFTVGPWEVTVNGTASPVGGLPPFHAKVVHDTIMAIMVLSPFGGTTAGWPDAEDRFIEDIIALTSPMAGESS